jgi:hypothetical protein
MAREIVLDNTTLRYQHRLRLAGAQCHVSSNSGILGDTLRGWIQEQPQQEWETFSLRVLVGDDKANDAVGAPHFRGLGHVVVASFGPANIFVFDLLRRAITATVSQEIAEQPAFWDRTLLPIALGVLGPAVGVVPIHAACLAVNGEGMLIAGASGMGKSTLSVALAQNGFDFISDDWSYLTLCQGRLLAHGMSVPAKLLPDAVTHFPFLSQYRVGVALNQELAYELPIQEVGAAVRTCCEPRWFLFLERSSRPGCRFVPVSADQARQYVLRSVERLPSELSHLVPARDRTIARLQQLSCWKLIYGGPPRVAVDGLQQFLAELQQGVEA